MAVTDRPTTNLAAETESLGAEAMQRFFELTPALFATIGFDGYFKSINPAWGKVLGYSVGELRARPYIEFIHPDDRSATLAVAYKLAEGQTVTHFVNRYLAKDGSSRHIDWYAGSDVENQLMYCMANDITEVTAAQNALSEKAELLDLAHDAIIVVGADDMKIRYWNSGAEVLYGYRADEAMGWKSTELLLAELPIPLSEILETVRKQGRWEGEIRHRTKVGAEVVMESRWALRRDAAGQADAILEINRDATARSQAQDALRQANARLERRVEERTQQLLTINKELEAFSHTVAHDLRAPMRAINAFVDILLQEHPEELDEDARDALHEIQTNSARMAKLIDELLELAQLGRHQLQLAHVDMTALAQRAARVLAPELAGREIDIQIKPLPPAEGDGPLLEQVFTNLLSNAIKFTRGRQPAHIEMGASDEAGGPVYYVKDNGVGFDMRYSDKLFGVFQRLHSRDEFEGNGVGLASVQRIVQRHGGRVWAQSELGVGTTFFFTLGGQSNDR
jgi:PAS domain S-box-containing protein